MPGRASDHDRFSRDVHEHAERYAKMGLSVLPLLFAKKDPAIKWKPYQQRLADASERYLWFIEQHYQCGIVLGAVSDWVVGLDFDSKDKPAIQRAYDAWRADFPMIGRLPMVRTGNGGIHLYFRSPIPIPYQALTMYGVRVEVRTSGHYLVAPPSIHPDTGDPYVWERPPWPDGFPIVHHSALGIPDKEMHEDGERDEPFVEGEPLSPAELATIADLLAPHYVDGAKHNLALAVSGWLAGKNIPELDAWTIVADLAEQGDDRRKLRAAVRDTYRKAAEGEVTAGWSRLTDDDDPLISPATAKQLDLLLRGRAARFVWPKPGGDADRPWLITIQDFLAEPDEGEDWLVDTLIRAQTLFWIAGAPKTLKSWLLDDLLTSIAAGVPAFDAFHVARPRPVVLVQEESARQYLRRRLAMGLAGHELDPGAAGQFFVVTNRRFRLDKPDHVRRLIDECLERYRPAIIGLDPYRNLHWMDENSSDEMARVIELLLNIRDEFEIALAIVHHMSKNILARDAGEQMRGSSVLWAAADGALFVSAFADDAARVKVNAVLKEGGASPGFILRADFAEDGSRARLRLVSQEKHAPSADPALRDHIAANPWRTLEELCAALDASPRRMQPRLAVLETVGLIIRHRRHRRAKYRYATPDCDLPPPE